MLLQFIFFLAFAVALIYYVSILTNPHYVEKVKQDRFLMNETQAKIRIIEDENQIAADASPAGSRSNCRAPVG